MMESIRAIEMSSIYRVSFTCPAFFISAFRSYDTTTVQGFRDSLILAQELPSTILVYYVDVDMASLFHNTAYTF